MVLESCVRTGNSKCKITSLKGSDCVVYEIQSEGQVGGKKRVVHRNMIMPVRAKFSQLSETQGKEDKTPSEVKSTQNGKDDRKSELNKKDNQLVQKEKRRKNRNSKKKVTFSEVGNEDAGEKDEEEVGFYPCEFELMRKEEEQQGPVDFNIEEVADGGELVDDSVEEVEIE